ncbi:19543_t:CDS:2, partial [Gigaspora margarita]
MLIILGVRKRTHGNSPFGFDEDIGQQNLIHGELEFSEVYLNVHCDLEAETEYQRIEFTMPTTGLT